MNNGFCRTPDFCTVVVAIICWFFHQSFCQFLWQCFRRSSRHICRFFPLIVLLLFPQIFPLIILPIFAVSLPIFCQFWYLLYCLFFTKNVLFFSDFCTDSCTDFSPFYTIFHHDFCTYFSIDYNTDFLYQLVHWFLHQICPLFYDFHKFSTFRLHN